MTQQKQSTDTIREWRPERTTLRERLRELARTHAPRFLRPALRELRYRLRGEADGVDALQREVRDLHGQWRTILDRSASQGTGSAGPHVLFLTGFGLGTAFATREPILMMALRRRGCRLSALFCDATLPACEFNDAGNHRPGAGALSHGLTAEAKLSTCRRCASNIRTTFADLGVEQFPYHQFISERDLALAREATRGVTFENFRSFEYDGIQVGEEAFASILRVTFRGTVEDTQDNRALVERYVLAGVVMARACEAALRSLRPDRIVMPHGVYITHGIAAKVARKLGIPFFVYSGGVRKDTLILSANQTYHRSLVSEPNALWEHDELTPEQRERTLRYALSKQSGGVDALNYHPTPVADAATLYETLGIDGSRSIVSLFTNVIWDAQIYYDGTAFKNILEWMRFSIDELAKNPRVWAVIRVHPAEVKGGLPTRQPFLPEIRKWFPTLPENVRVIPPESNISSYTLAEQSRAAVIYGTKMGLELAIRGIPVIICGQTFSRNKGIAIDIASKAQYAELLNRVHTLDRVGPATVERAIRYAHYLYFRRMIDFPYLKLANYNTFEGKRIALASLEELDAGRDVGLDNICSAITDLTQPMLLPQVHVASR